MARRTATYGVRYRGCTALTDLKKRLSSAIAKNTRGPTSIVPLNAPHAETATMIETTVTPTPPKTALMLSAATRGDFASASIGSMYKYATLAARYITAIATVPSTMARGSVRCGSLTSPATNDTSPTPSYAQSTEINASPKPPAETTPAETDRLDIVPPDDPPNSKTRSTTDARPRNFASVEMPVTAVAIRTPRILIVPATTIAVAAKRLVPIPRPAGSTPIARRKYSAKTVEIAPAEDARISTSSDHPNRKAGSRPHPSRR